MEKIFYGIHSSPFGDIILAKSEKGLCWLGFMEAGYKGDGKSRMVSHFPEAEFIRDQAGIKSMAGEIIKAWEEDRAPAIALDLRGTNFQKSVWAALLNIPKGQVITYSDVANDIGKPKAVRAVGSAVGENPVSLVVPCHRVVPKSGGVGNYGWGPAIKAKILKKERK